MSSVTHALLLTHIETGDTNQASKLIQDHDMNVNVPDDSGNTLLHWAVSKNDEDMVKLLLIYGADMDVISKPATGGLSPLHLAARHNYFKIGQLLLAAGASVDILSVTCCTPLMEAAKQGQMHMVNVLIAAGANAMLVDENGFSSQYFAKKGGYMDIAEKLPKVSLDMWNHIKSQPDFKAKLEIMKSTAGGKKKKGGSKKKGKKK